MLATLINDNYAISNKTIDQHLGGINVDASNGSYANLDGTNNLILVPL